MGFFSAIFDAAKEANDEAHGARLLQDVQSSFAAMGALDKSVLYLPIGASKLLFDTDFIFNLALRNICTYNKSGATR